VDHFLLVGQSLCVAWLAMIDQFDQLIVSDCLLANTVAIWFTYLVMLMLKHHCAVAYLL
jgi:hypothetical protein